jgi:hypothetical protein
MLSRWERKENKDLGIAAGYVIVYAGRGRSASPAEIAKFFGRLPAER